MNYYNENDPDCAQWLRNLISAGHLPNGIVDDRSITDVTPGDVRGFTQCHFFAGIGGWPFAFRLAGWPDDRPVWSGSCPCQPFSANNRGRRGTDDERHLWPIWFANLIEPCRPPVVVGEQVASDDGTEWLDIVFNDLERTGYTTGAADLCAAGVAAPHVRQRLYWLGYPNHAGLQGHARNERYQEGRPVAVGSTAAAGFWSAADWVECRDARRRPIQPGTFPLANGISGRMGRLRAYGNAIVPQLAAEFIRCIPD